MGFDSREYEYADTKVSILGKELSGLRGLTWKKKQDKELVYGAGNKPVSVGRGNVSYEGSLMLLKSEYDEMNLAAIAAGYNDIIEVPGNLINITCTFSKATPVRLQTNSLINVEFTEMEDGMKTGDKFKEITLPFIFTRLKTA